MRRNLSQLPDQLPTQSVGSRADESLSPEDLCDLVVRTLENRKGRDILVLDVSGMTDIADRMVFASGTSNRHVKALFEQVIEAAKQRRQAILGVEGRETCEWVLLDLGDVMVHVMQVATREFYDLERLWRPLAADSTG